MHTKLHYTNFSLKGVVCLLFDSSTQTDGLNWLLRVESVGRLETNLYLDSDLVDDAKDVRTATTFYAVYLFGLLLLLT